MSLITWIVPRGNVSSAEKRAISAIAESMLGISRASGANFANSVSRSSRSFFFDSITRQDALDLKSHAKQTSPRLHQPGTSEWTFEQKVVNDAKGVKGTQPVILTPGTHPTRRVAVKRRKVKFVITSEYGLVRHTTRSSVMDLGQDKRTILFAVIASYALSAPTTRCAGVFHR